MASSREVRTPAARVIAVYEPDMPRAVAALLAMLCWTSRQEKATCDWSSQVADAEEPKDVPPTGTPA
jgi:hypothetical protein